VGKLLSWIVLGALAWLAWRVFVILQRKQARTRAGAGSGAVGPRPPATPESMIRCDRCGVYLPASEAVVDGDRRYCCAAHRDGR